MDVTPVLTVFKMVAPEFSSVGDETVSKWIELCLPLVSSKRLGKLYTQALALLCAHRMKLAGVGTSAGADPLEDVGNISIGNLIRVSQYSEGETSIGLGGNLTQFTQDANSEYALTAYGIQYLKLIRMMMSITSAGEHNGRI